VKTLAGAGKPGLSAYLEAAELQEDLDAIGFSTAWGYGLHETCIGNSGPAAKGNLRAIP